MDEEEGRGEPSLFVLQEGLSWASACMDWSSFRVWEREIFCHCPRHRLGRLFLVTCMGGCSSPSSRVKACTKKASPFFSIKVACRSFILIFSDTLDYRVFAYTEALISVLLTIGFSRKWTSQSSHTIVSVFYPFSNSDIRLAHISFAFTMIPPHAHNTYTHTQNPIYIFPIVSTVA